MLTGGEPLLHPNIETIIARNGVLAINTNGLLKSKLDSLSNLKQIYWFNTNKVSSDQSNFINFRFGVEDVIDARGTVNGIQEFSTCPYNYINYAYVYHKGMYYNCCNAYSIKTFTNEGFGYNSIEDLDNAEHVSVCHLCGERGLDITLPKKKNYTIRELYDKYNTPNMDRR
jgi:hypothetical protein